MKNKKQIFWFIFLLSTLLIFLFTGCKSKTVLVPVDKVKIEYKERLRVDSIYNRDTVKIYGRNDTIFKDVIKWRERFRVDTVSVVKVDSIPYKVEVVKEVNKLTKWQKMRLTAFNIILTLLGGYLVFFIYRLVSLK